MAEYIELTMLNEILRAKRMSLVPQDDDYAMGFCEAIKTCNFVPAAEVVPVVPSWWECYETSAFGGYKDGEAVWWPRKFYRCERCRRGSAIRSNYCPNCGAKMDGGSDG